MPADQIQFTPTQLRSVVMRLARRLRQEVGPDITWSQQSALATVERLGPISLKDLADAEYITPPSMTRISTCLEERGWVARIHDPADRRVARLAITEAGRSTLAESRTRRDAYLAERLAAMSPEDYDALNRALPLLRQLSEEPGL